MGERGDPRTSVKVIMNTAWRSWLIRLMEENHSSVEAMQNFSVKFCSSHMYHMWS